MPGRAALSPYRSLRARRALDASASTVIVDGLPVTLNGGSGGSGGSHSVSFGDVAISKPDGDPYADFNVASPVSVTLERPSIVTAGYYANFPQDDPDYDAVSQGGVQLALTGNVPGDWGSSFGLGNFQSSDSWSAAPVGSDVLVPEGELELQIMAHYNPGSPAIYALYLVTGHAGDTFKAQIQHFNADQTEQITLRTDPLTAPTAQQLQDALNAVWDGDGEFTVSDGGVAGVGRAWTVTCPLGQHMTGMDVVGTDNAWHANLGGAQQQAQELPEAPSPITVRDVTIVLDVA